MSNDFWSTLNKKKKEELLKSTQTKQTSSTSKTSEELKTSDFWSALDDDKKEALLSSATTISAPMRSSLLDDDDDIAPYVKGGNKDSVFKSGGFSDGVDGVGDFFGDLGQTIGGTVGDLGMGIVKGAGRLVEGIVDLGTYGVAGVADLFGADEFANKTKKVAQYSATDEWTKGATNWLDQYSVLGNKADMVSEGIGQVGTIILTGGLGAAGGLSSAGATALTTAITAASGMGSGMNEAYASGASDGKAVAYGATVGTIEAATELIFGGLGKGVKALGVSKGLTSIDDVFAKKLSNTAAKFIASEAGQKVVGNTIEYAVKSGAEGVEEVLSGIGSAMAKDLYLLNGEDEKAFNEILKDENLLEQFVVGSIVSGIAQGGDFISSNRSGRDFVSGLSKNEQTVVDKVYEQRLAEESENKTLSNKDKNKLYERVVEEMKRGYVTTDEIESILGGETYKGYKDLTDKKTSLEERKTAIENEVKDLVKTPESQFTVEQREKLNSLREEAKNIDKSLSSLGIDEAKSNLFNEVNKLTEKDTFLRESYNDLIRKEQDIQIDENQYKGTKFEDAAKKTIENARNAKANNSNRVRDFVEFSAKYSSVSGQVVDFKDADQINKILEDQLNAQIATLQQSTTEADKVKLSELQDMLKQVQEGKIHVNGVKTKDGIAINLKSPNYLNAVLGHEATHPLEGLKSYEALQKAVFKFAQAKGDYEGRRKVIEALYKNMDGTTVDQELTADLLGDYLFTDYDFIMNLSTEHRNVFQQIYDRVKYMLKLATAGSKEARELEKVKHLFEKALRESAETSQNTEQKERSKDEKGGVSYDETSESYSPVRFSLGTWDKSDYVTERNEAVADMAKALGITEEKASQYIDSVNSIAKMIADDKARLDYEASPGRSAFVSNAEYGGSIDFSTICKKRRLFTGTFEAIQNALPNTALTAEEVLEIRKMMKDKGYEVSCGLCYVEGSRANMGQFTKQFIERYKETNPEYVPNMAEMNTATGQEQIRKEHPEVYEAYEYFMNHYGKLSADDKALFASQQKPKMYQMATEYSGEILDKFGGQESSVQEKNKNGGLRLQSFSDFEIIHLIDSMQVIMDMSRVGLAGQAYTKVPDFAWALGDTGLKINLSLIAKDVDANGRLVLDEVEGMKESDAMALRDRYSDNVGTILVVFTDEQLKAAMADERIDYIIPYHRSQWKTSQYESMGLPENTKDYTSWQNESYIEPVYNKNGKKQRPSNYMPNTYWDFHKSGKENAEKYLQMCAENNRRPKFSHLLVDNGDGSYALQPDGSTDGYWKTLIDFKMYNNEGIGVPQNPVTPDFNMEEAQRMLDEYTGGHTKFPVAKDIVEEFVSKHPDNIAPTEVKFSLSKDIENFDNSWYNEVELPSVERDRVQSEALTWNADKRNQLITQTLSNGITYRYVIDDDGIVHIYGKKALDNIHDLGEDYGNTDTTQPDSIAEELWTGQRDNGSDSRFSRDGRKPGKDDTNDNYFVSGEGRSNGTGYTENRTNAHRKPQGWHFNDDGSVEVTYSDGTKEIEYPDGKKASSTDGVFFDGENPQNSLSTEGEKRILGGSYRFEGKDFRVKSNGQDIAPVAEGVAENATADAPMPKDANATPKSARIADGTRGEELLVESLDNYPMETMEQKIAERIRAIEGELADNRDVRREAEANYSNQIAKLKKEYNSKKNKETKVAYGLLQSISRLERLKASTDAEFAKRISDLEARVEKMKDPQYSRAMYKKAKMEEHAKFAEDLIGDTSTWVDKKLGLQYATNTERRNLRDIVRDENGNADIARADAINDALNGQYNRNQAERNRKDNEISKKYLDLKVNRHESVYANMLGELRSNPETTLTEKDVNEYYEKHKNKIDTKKVDKFIEYVRSDLDYFFETLNTKLREQGMKEIPYRKGYFPHKVEPKQNFIQKLLNWKTQDNEIPTSIAGLTEDFKPVKSYQSFDKQRHTDKTDYDLLRLFQNYKNGALDWIYHLEDIQKRRAVENYIRYTHSEEGIQARIKEVYANEDMDADEAQAQIEHILAEAKNPLNNFVQDFTTHTNILAGKKNSLDRAVEQGTNRKIYTVMQNVQNRTSANMVLANVRSALTNFIPITQSWAQVSPLRSLQATKDTIANAIKDDGLINKSTFLTNRLREADSLYKTNWDKVLDKAGIMFEVVDNFSSQVIWRSKYNQNLANGMSEAAAIANADQFAENVMAGRSKGNEPTLFNAKNPLVKAFTMFQLEVNNQYGYLFKDVPNDLKAETEHWKLNLAKGYTTAFIGAYVYNALLEQVAGSGAALDPIGIIEDLLRDLGLFDDDEEKEPDEVVTNLVDNVVEELPFVGGLFGGGRIPISSAIPYGGEYSGGFSQASKDVVSALGAVGDVIKGNGDEADWSGAKNLGKELMNPILNVGLPVAGGQIKKTYQGLSMFNTDEDHPIAGSYTDSGNLRFPVEDTLENRIQAGIFGQYASENAREYFDNGYAPLKEKQIQEYIDVDMPIADYWKYREGLSGLKTQAEKADYINSLNIEDWQKNLLMNNILDRKEDVDMSNYDDYSNWEEFDYAQKNPDKYAFAKSVGGYYDYKAYSEALYNIKADKDEYGKSITGSRKEKVLNYINNLDADYETKIILWKSEYPSDDTYNMEIINYLNNRADLTYEERVAILTELGFTVSGDTVYWD